MSTTSSSQPLPEAQPIEAEMISVHGRYLMISVPSIEGLLMQEFTTTSGLYRLNNHAKRGYYLDIVVGGMNRQCSAADLGLIPEQRNNLSRTFMWTKELDDYLRQRVIGTGPYARFGFTHYMVMIDHTLSRVEKELASQKVHSGLPRGRESPYTRPVLKRLMGDSS